ncbi:YSIRK-type signal peptide-containing protein, partial [Lactobacillus amylovorus]|uniref:YSIRK-type signal peptide-containing protein n=1 Tax=Lactobacillus amylovorus TaxID=1604 RepID=UPI00232F1955
MVRKKNKMFVDSADRTPHYSLRKLSVGVASVLLSTTLWMGANGSVAHADTINDATVAGKVEDKLDPSETHKDQTQAQTAESTSQASVASAEKQNGEAQKGQAQVAVANANQAVKKQAQEVDSANAEAQTATANDAQADVAKQEPAAQSKQPAPKAQASAPASVKEQASTAEGQTNGSANAGAAIDATTKAKKDSANPEANSSAAATEDAKNESTTLDVNQAFKMPINKKMVMASLASAAKPTNTADSISELEKANEDTTAVPGFSVTDPEYPSEMYRDPDPKHYSFFWASQPGNGYQTVISTNRNGDGQIHVFELDQSNNVLYTLDLDKNQSSTSSQTGVTYYNDEYAGLLSAGSLGGWIQPKKWTLKYEVSGGKSDQLYDSISFIVPRLNTQVTSYVTSHKDKDGKDIINDIVDKNGNKIEPVVQQGLDGQKYTTTDTKVIDGYYAIAPSNAQGTMSPYGKIGSKYEKNYHDGYISEYTQINNDGDMYVQMYREDERGNRIAVTRAVIIKPGDIYTYSRVGKTYYLRSIYIPQTIDIKYVYKKLGNTVLVDEDNNPFMGNTPTQYPNDPNDPTKAGKVVIPQYEGYTPTINGVPVGPDGFIPTDPGEDTIVVYTANPAKALVRFIDNTEKRTLDNLELSGKTGKTIDFGTANAQLK